MSETLSTLNGSDAVETPSMDFADEIMASIKQQPLGGDKFQEQLLNLAINHADIAAQVVENAAKFDDLYQLILEALKQGRGATRQNYNFYLEGKNMTPAEQAGNMNVYCRIQIRYEKVENADGLFDYLDRHAVNNQKEVLCRQFKSGDHSAAIIQQLAAWGVDLGQVKGALIIQRLKDKTYQADDIGNGQLFAAAYGDDLIYVSEWKRWLTWDGKRWSPIADERVQLNAQDLVRFVMPMLATTIKDDEKRTKYLKHVVASTAAFKIDSMIKNAKGRMAVTVTVLNANAMLVNFQNGTMNCETGEMKPHNRKDYLTKISPCNFNADATAPTWEKFLNRTIVDANGKTNNDLIQFLQTAMGYSMTGSVQEECMLILWGPGGTGKSTFTETMLHCLGDYGLTLATSVLLETPNGGNNDNLADLFGVHCAIANETAAGGKFNEARVKALTGGDRITAMRKYEHSFMFQPQHKIWLVCNDRPRVSPTDLGMWRRLRLVPFLAELTAQEKDLTLKSRLRTDEADGIMAWVVQGLRRWLKEGLPIPKQVEDATAQYQADSDVFGMFLADNCIMDADAKVRAGDLFKAYLRWANDNGMKHTMTAVGLAAVLKQRGYVQSKRSDANYWIGIGLDDSNHTCADDNRAF